MNLARINSLWSRRPTPALPPLTSSSQPSTKAALSFQILPNDARRFIGRQTILDRSHNVHGYELLCRSGWENSFSGDPDRATRLMIADGTLYGFDDLTHGAPVFLNCTRDALVNDLVTLLPASTVIEILETVVADPEVIQACVRYKSMGYKLALDDFRIHEGMEGLLSLADYIKVDFRLSDSAERRAILNMVRRYDLTLVAEKIETEQEFQEALAEGFSLFQGYFFCRPAVFSKKQAPVSGANYFSLLAALGQPNLNFSELAQLLKTEIVLSYQVLRLVNAAGVGMDRTIDSLEQALLAVGEKQFSKLLLNAIAVEVCANRSSELLLHVLHLARFLELLAPLIGEDSAEQYMLGILSLIDAMLDVSSKDLVQSLPLKEEVKQALRGVRNKVGTGLRLFDCYRQADWNGCIDSCVQLNLSEGAVMDLYWRALLWAERLAHDEPRGAHV